MTRMQTRANLLANAQQLDMFAALNAPVADPLQIDIRDILARPAAPDLFAIEHAIAVAEASADPLDLDDDENAAGEWIAPPATDRQRCVDEWEAERAAIEAAKAVNAPEVLRWGKPNDRNTYFEIHLLRDGAHWRVRTDFSMPNTGGSGPFGPAIHDTREAALLDALRKRLASIAKHIAGGCDGMYGKESQWRDLARWCIAQAPSAMFGGPDLAAEFAALAASEEARETRRRAALCAVNALERAGRDIVLAAGVYGYPDLIHDTNAAPSPGAGADPVAHACEWPATWAVSGHAPDQLRITVYPRHGHASNAVVTRTIDALRAGLSVPVTVAEEVTDCRPYYRADRWTWDE